MSLIQEALKRKEHDEAQNKPEAGSAEKVPAVSPPADVKLSIARQPAAEAKNTDIPLSSPLQSMPVAGQTQSAASQPIRRTTSFWWVIVAAVAILTVLTVAAGSVFFFYHWLSPVKAKISPPAYQINKTATTAAGGTNMVIGQPLSAGDTERKPVSVKSGLRQDEPTPVRAKTPPESSADVRWPVFKLTGILRGSRSVESTAFINGKMINAGQTIDDVTILEIQADGVLLKRGAEKRFLRVGATLY